MQRGLRKWPERTEESRSSGASEGGGEREEPTELVCWEDGSRAKAGAGRAGWGGGVVRWNLLQSSRGEVMREDWDRAGAWEWRGGGSRESGLGRTVWLWVGIRNVNVEKSKPSVSSLR